MSKYQLTPEQLALSEARKAKKLEKASIPQSPLPSTVNVHLKQRPWLTIPRPELHSPEAQRVKVVTWNLLAQCLVRRDLFPSSDCLKASQREPMIHSELLAHDADVFCLQEVDRLDRLLPILCRAGYSAQFASGPGKKHGCLIVYKEHLYSMTHHKIIEYDDEEVRSTGDNTYRRGRTFQTRNVGLIVSLQSKARPSEGLVVATTHLFWHPMYTYERTRQASILIKAVVDFRSAHDLSSWPCLLCGDFNFTPDDLPYSLCVGDSLLPSQTEHFTASQVVHKSVDSNVSTALRDAEGEEEEEGDPDKTITNARPAAEGDGLLSVTELVSIFRELPRLRSIYDEGLGLCFDAHPETFGERGPLPTGRRGRYEPAYSSYTFWWQSTIDYMFLIDPEGASSVVVRLLAPHRKADLIPGLPRRGICGSDHVALGGEVIWIRN